MSLSVEKSPRVEDLISTEDDTLGSSISLSVGENSIHIKEKPRANKESEQQSIDKKDIQEKWWLNRPETRLEIFSAKSTEGKMKHSPTPSSDVSSSMREFLEKERMCQAVPKIETEVKDKDDTLCDKLASTAFDKYPSDFENATDEDIGSILEEMSKIAGALSPNSGPDHTKSDGSNKIPTEEEKSVEELLEEAEKLVRKNSSTLSKSASRSDTLVLENDQDDNLNRVRQLEADIFQLIEEEVHKESEKIKRSPKNEKKRESFEVIYENLNSLKPPKTLELQRRKFEEQKVEISSSSDLDDPIERHSKSEELKNTKKIEIEKENLQKEITDVDKDFFEDLLKRSKEKAEGGMSGSSSFGQEDFSHFLKLLQGQTDKKEPELKEPNAMYDLLLKSTNGEATSIEEGPLTNGKTPEFPEKEFSEILRKELPANDDSHAKHEIHESDSSMSEEQSKSAPNSPSIGMTFSKNLNDTTSKKSATKGIESNKNTTEGKKINSDGELYTVGLTPRLELFADAIPKLMAEKLNENVAKESVGKIDNATDKDSVCSETKVEADVVNTVKILKASKINHHEVASTSRKVTDISKVTDRVVSVPGNKQSKKEIRFCKSKSYDQICQPPLRVSLENIRASKGLETSKRTAISNSANRKSPTVKSKVQSKPISRINSDQFQKSKPHAFSKSKTEATKIGSTSSLPAACKTIQIKSPDGYRKNLAGGDTKNLKRDWEALYREEKYKNTLLKQQLEADAKMYKSQIEDMRTSFEGELFALKKQNIILKVRVDELSLHERRPEIHTKSDTRVTLLEQELEKQESLIRAYETENKKLMQDTRRMQEELKNLQSRQKSTVPVNDMQQLADRVKDLQEETLKLTLEVSNLKEKNADYLLKNDDLTQQNNLLTDELEMFKDQLRAKNNFITDRLQALTSTELELKKQIEDLSIKLSSKSEQLRVTKQELDKMQQNVLPLEKELLELRVKEGNLLEKLQISRSHVEREKQLTQKLKDQVILDNKKVLDLNRQVRELERILKRKNPDSVSALILTANSEQEKIRSEKVKLLEERIASLESEIKTKEDIARQSLTDLQTKFTNMKEKYATQVAELETKLSETAKNYKSYNDAFTQTTMKYVEDKGMETNKRDDKASTADKGTKIGLKLQNPKEDAHLLATIRGLKLELTSKDRAVLKITKEYQELQKTNKRLQKEREKLLNDRRTFRSMDFDRVFQRTKNGDGNDQNSNVYQNGHNGVTDSQRLSSSTPKLYDPMQYTENSKNGVIKKLTNENDILKEELNKINKDFMTLKSKRLHDLNLLQEEHEREMATVVKEYSVKFGDSKAVKLQVQINTQRAIISNLKEQVEKLRDYKEQVVVLKAEREHLETKVKTLTEKVKYLSTPGTEQLQLLQDKITILQQRHESREMTLQTLVRDLLRNRTQCKDCKNEKGKNRQLCYFRQELDHILGMLQEIANVH